MSINPTPCFMKNKQMTVRIALVRMILTNGFPAFIRPQGVPG